MSAAEIACPHCGRVNEAHEGPTPGAAPAPGDVSICWACRGIGIYTEDGIRLPTPEEDAEIRNEPQLKEALAAIAESYTPRQASKLRWGQA